MHRNFKAIVLLLILLVWLGTQTAAAQKAPVLIGATVSHEGKYVEPSAMMEKAFELWAHEVNQQGGLLGRKVKLILYDDKSQKDRARTLYKKLIEQDKVDLLFSPYSTPLTLAASEISEQHKMLMLAVAAAADAPWQRGFKYLFQLYAPARRQFIGLIDMMGKNGYKSLSILYDDTSAFNRDIAQGVLDWAALYKIDIALNLGYRNGEQDLPGLLEKVKTTNAGGLLLSAYPPDCYVLLNLVNKMAYKPSVLAMTIAPAHPAFHKKVGPVSNKIFGTTQWEPIERIPFPGTRKFVKDFNEFAGHMPSFHAASAYSACQLYKQAIQKTRSFESLKLRDYIASLDTVTVLGRFKVDPSGLQVGHNSFIIQWQNGKKEIVWPRKMQTAPPLF